MSIVNISAHTPTLHVQGSHSTAENERIINVGVFYTTESNMQKQSAEHFRLIIQILIKL